MVNVDLNLYAWVVRGKQRIAVLKALSSTQTPSYTFKKSKQFNERMSMNNTSDILRRFVKMGIAICINEEERVGRLYKLTGIGEKIRIELLKEVTNELIN